MMLISVIIPVFNSRKFLRKSLNSVINQTYKDLQIILVDDGSTDGSQKICDTYAKKDNRITVIHQKNAGVSRARNTGISQATGEYTIFIDSDDWIDLNYIQSCTDVLKNKKYDLLFTPYVREYENKKIENPIFGVKDTVYENYQIKSILLQKLIGPTDEQLKSPANLDDFSPIWSKFYKSDICKQVSFVDINKIGAEDTWFNIQYCSRIKNAYYLTKVKYHYNKQNDKSLITSYNPNNFTRKQKFYRALHTFILNSSNRTEYEHCLNNRKVIDLIGISNNIFGSNLTINNKYKEEAKILNKSLYTNTFESFNFDKLPLRWNIFFKLCKRKNIMLLTVLSILGENFKAYLK